MVFSRKFSFLIFFFFTFFLIGCSSSPKVDYSCNDCNVLFLNVDILRADYVGLLGSDVDLTPNIDEFFKNAIIFENVISHSGETLRSNMAVLTAQDLPLTMSPHLKLPFKKNFKKYPTIAEVLFREGYNTVNVNEGTRSGISAGLDRGFNDYSDLGLRNLIDVSLTVVKSKLLEREDPFFLLYRTSILHLKPYFFPLDRDHLESPNIIYKKHFDRYNVSYKGQGLSFYEQRKLAHTLYGQQVQYVDDELKGLFTSFDEDFLDTTIIVFYANHGEGLYDNKIQQHGFGYQSNVHVPLLIFHPKVNKEIRIKDHVFLIDLVPTIYEMLGVRSKNNLTGISLVPVIEGRPYTRDYIYGVNTHDRYILSEGWKFITIWEREKQLFNLTIDPQETRNVLDTHKDIARELEAVLYQKKVEQLQSN